MSQLRPALNQPTLRTRLSRIVGAVLALTIGLGLSVVAASPATAGGSDSPTPYTVTATTLTLPSGATFAYYQEINYRVTKLDGTGQVDLGVGNTYPHNGQWPRDLYWGKSVYTWTDHPGFPASYKTNGYCVTWVQVGHYNEHFGEGHQAPACWTPPPAPKYGVALYVYPKLNAALPAAWENSGLQTLIVQDVDNASEATNNYWTVFPAALPSNVCGPGWGVQQDKVSFTGSFAFPPNIEYPYDEIGWPPIYAAQHTDLSALITVPPCVEKDAAAAVQVWDPNCSVAGTATFTISNATWNATPPTTPGGPYTITATADSGHAFSDGSATKSFSYTIAGALDSNGADCYRPTPTVPGFDVIWGCGTYGSIDLVDSATVHYAIVSGDGRQGWNHVVATAIAPYTLNAGVKADWWIWLGSYWSCPQPTASAEVGACFADDSDDSFKNLKVTFDNADSVIARIFSIPGLGVFEWVPAGAVETKTIPVPNSGSPAYAVYAGLTKLTTIDAVPAFAGCIGAKLTGDPLHQNETCDAGVTQDGSIWVDRMTGLEYTIVDVTGAPVVVATLSGPGDGLVDVPAGDYRVSVVAIDGYVLDFSDPVTSGPWYYTVQEPEGGCVLIDPPVLSCLDVTQGVLELPAVFGVLWALDGDLAGASAGPLSVPLSATAVTVTAVPADVSIGFSPGTILWTFGLAGAALCELPEHGIWPTNATATDERCGTAAVTSGTITVGLAGGSSFFGEVDYFLDGSSTPMAAATANVAPGTHTVTAAPKNSEDGLDGRSEWTLVVGAAAVACELTTLAFTGATPVPWLVFAAFIILAGAAAIAMTKRRRDVTNG